MVKQSTAIAKYTKIIEKDPTNYQAYKEIGLYELAIADYNKAISLKPMNGMPYNNRGFTYLLMGKLEEACYWLKKAISIRNHPCFKAGVEEIS